MCYANLGCPKIKLFDDGSAIGDGNWGYVEIVVESIKTLQADRRKLRDALDHMRRVPEGDRTEHYPEGVESLKNLIADYDASLAIYETHIAQEKVKLRHTRRTIRRGAEVYLPSGFEGYRISDMSRNGNVVTIFRRGSDNDPGARFAGVSRGTQYRWHEESQGYRRKASKAKDDWTYLYRLTDVDIERRGALTFRS